MKNKIELLWFVAFTAVFAVFAAYVFWGTWSPDYAPVMPDCPVWHPISQSGQFVKWFSGWLQNGRFTPTEIFWSDGFLPGYWFQEFKYALALYLSGLGLAYFLRGRGLTHVASYGAGLLLGFCGYWATLFSAGHGGWFVWISYGVFAFGLIDRALANGSWRKWFLLGAVVAWGSFNQPDLWLLFTLFTGIYFLYRAFMIRRAGDAPAWSAWVKGVVIAAVACFAIGIPSFRGALTDMLAGRDKQIAESAGTALVGGKGKAADDASDAEKQKAADEARWIFATNWSMPPEDTLEFFIPRIHGDTSCPMTLQLGRAAGKDVRPYEGRLGRPLNAPVGNYRQHSLYVGRVTCFLALFALVICVLCLKDCFSKGKTVRPLDAFTSGFHLATSDVVFFAIAALVFWIFSMGRFCEPVYRLVYALPFGDYLRAPVKWHHLTEFCLCILAGYGLHAFYTILSRLPGNAKFATAVISAMVLVGVWDLAANDKLYCAPIDLRIVTHKNAAADEVVKRGKGATCDLLEGGRGLLSWSFNARGLGMNADPSAPRTRFVFVGNEQAKRTPQLANWLKAKATLVGTYAFMRDGIRSAAPQDSNVSLYQMNGVPPPAANPQRPPIDAVTLAFGIVSFLGFVAVAWILIVGCRRGGTFTAAGRVV